MSQLLILQKNRLWLLNFSLSFQSTLTNAFPTKHLVQHEITLGEGVLPISDFIRGGSSRKGSFLRVGRGGFSEKLSFRSRDLGIQRAFQNIWTRYIGDETMSFQTEKETWSDKL